LFSRASLNFNPEKQKKLITLWIRIHELLKKISDVYVGAKIPNQNIWIDPISQKLREQFSVVPGHPLREVVCYTHAIAAASGATGSDSPYSIVTTR
jgi:hypothetical protein